MNTDHFRFHHQHLHLTAPFGADAFGKKAEAFARWFGTPVFLIGQTLVVALWIALNIVGAARAWDPYPFILLNLVFSLQRVAGFHPGRVEFGHSSIWTPRRQFSEQRVFEYADCVGSHPLDNTSGRSRRAAGRLTGGGFRAPLGPVWSTVVRGRVGLPSAVGAANRRAPGPACHARQSVRSSSIAASRSRARIAGAGKRVAFRNRSMVPSPPIGTRTPAGRR